MGTRKTERSVADEGCVDNRFWLTSGRHQNCIKWRNVQHWSCASRRDKKLWFLDHVNPGSYAVVVAKIRSQIMEHMSSKFRKTCPVGFGQSWKQIQKKVKFNSNWKVVKMKVLQFFEANNFYFGIILIRGRLLPQNGSGRYSQVFDETIMKSLDQIIRIGAKLGFRAWIQASFLHGKSSRPLYTWRVMADCNNTNRTNTSPTSSTFIFLPCIFLLVLRRSSS